jgi:hypothetical protein
VEACTLQGMGNVLNEEKKQQVLALGRLGWPLRQIQKATHIRRETASQYLKAAGIAVRPPRGWGRRAPKPANEVITDFGAGKPAVAVIPNGKPKTNLENPSTKRKASSKPANEVITGSEVIPHLQSAQASWPRLYPQPDGLAVSNLSTLGTMSGFSTGGIPKTQGLVD